MSTPNNPHQLHPDTVADFIDLVRRASEEAGTPQPSFVTNHQAGDVALVASNAPRPYHGLGKPRSKADYEYEVTPDKIVVILDQDRGNVSVTNDIDNVLADIAAQEGLPSLRGYGILYCDSMGQWDGVRMSYDTDRFQCFYPVGGSSEAEALAIYRAER